MMALKFHPKEGDIRMDFVHPSPMLACAYHMLHGVNWGLGGEVAD